MSPLFEEALQKLICSCCKKYLSVFPVKVYANKNVICGRCGDKKGGTISHLYELVAKQLKFPCINRFEGCREVLPTSDIENHETTCYSYEHNCPLCSDVNGNMRSSKSVHKDEGVVINLINHRYPKNIIFCKFHVWNPALDIKEYLFDKKHVDVQCELPQIIDGSSETALLNFKFHNISKLTTVEICSDFKYWVGNMLWELLISKCKGHLIVYLRSVKRLLKKSKVTATFTLVSLTPLKNVRGSFVKDYERFSTGLRYSMCISWVGLFNPIMNFVNNDSIQFQVFINVLPHEEGTCNKCHEVCTSCSKIETVADCDC